MTREQDIEAALTNANAEAVGAAIAAELLLKPKKGFTPHRYNCLNGDKTNVGLARVVVRIILDTLHERGVR